MTCPNDLPCGSCLGGLEGRVRTVAVNGASASTAGVGGFEVASSGVPLFAQQCCCSGHGRDSKLLPELPNLMHGQPVLAPMLSENLSAPSRWVVHGR